MLFGVNWIKKIAKNLLLIRGSIVFICGFVPKLMEHVIKSDFENKYAVGAPGGGEARSFLLLPQCHIF